MALNRTVEIFLNNARTPGRITLRSLTDTNVASFVWVEDDKFKVRLRFVDLDTTFGAGAVATRLDVDNVIILGARARRGSGSLLFSVTDFVETVVPAAGDTPADYYYEALLDLDTELMSAVFGSNDTVTLWIDVEVQAPDSLGGADPDRLTWQFQVNVNRQAYAGDSTPVPSEPTYPAPGLLALRIPPNSNYRIITDGAGGALLQVKSATSGKFHTLLVTGAVGAETLTIGPAEA